jgi:NADH:ubiquinone oxidoreductase subunit H
VTDGLPTAVLVSFLVTALFLDGWMIWGVREYRRTGRAMWLWLGILMGVSLLAAVLRYPR